VEFVFLLLFVLCIQDFYGKCRVYPSIFSFVSSRKVNGKTNRTYQDNDSNVSSNENEDEISVRSLDSAIESKRSTSLSTNNRDKKAYLKSLERSLRTGRPMQDNDNDHPNENDSPSIPFKFIRHCINKYIRRKTTDTFETTEL
jgi:hypothetical protein